MTRKRMIPMTDDQIFLSEVSKNREQTDRLLKMVYEAKIRIRFYIFILVLIFLCGLGVGLNIK